MLRARHVWFARSIVWGARLADEDGGRRVILDLRKFHELEPTAPVEGVPCLPA